MNIFKIGKALSVGYSLLAISDDIEESIEGVKAIAAEVKEADSAKDKMLTLLESLTSNEDTIAKLTTAILEPFDEYTGLDVKEIKAVLVVLKDVLEVVQKAVDAEDTTEESSEEVE